MIKYSFYNNNLINLMIVCDNGEVVGIKKVNNIQNSSLIIKNIIHEELDEYFYDGRKKFSFPIKFKSGTEFQKKVWETLIQIPYGETTSYKKIAEIIGKVGAYRAVGNAINKNPIIIAVPCHRVVGINGNLVGYSGGLQLKQQLLNLEKGVFFINKKIFH